MTLRIAIVGAESTGKTTLAAALAPALARATGLRTAWVPELLRGWCQRVGRTPQAHEQASILRAQHVLIEEAAEAHAIVVCDTTALMTAVYSRIVFGDRSLDARALEFHARVDATLLTALDLPWVADGLQRDGPQVQAPVDAMLRELLEQGALPYQVVGGAGPARLAQALAALQPLLRRPPPAAKAARRSGHAAAARWRCGCCALAETAPAPPPGY